MQPIGLTLLFIFQTAKSICCRVIEPRPVRSSKRAHIDPRLGSDSRYCKIFRKHYISRKQKIQHLCKDIYKMGNEWSHMKHNIYILRFNTYNNYLKLTCYSHSAKLMQKHSSNALTLAHRINNQCNYTEIVPQLMQWHTFKTLTQMIRNQCNFICLIVY